MNSRTLFAVRSRHRVDVMRHALYVEQMGRIGQIYVDSESVQSRADRIHIESTGIN
jgi:hypothetical protein